MNNIENNRPCIRFPLTVKEMEIDRVKHHRQSFEENQEQHQIMNFVNLLDHFNNCDTLG